MLTNTMKQFDSNTKLGNIITHEEIEKWDSDVIFDCATASGKSTFILNNLSEYCNIKSKKILFLCNRIEIKNEMSNIVKGKYIQNVDVKTYQWLQSQLKLNRNVKLDYDYIACDESSHFLETFDLYTDLSFNYIMKHPARKIFMSATAKPLFAHLLDSKTVLPHNYYYIPKDYSYVDYFVFYRKANSYLDIVKYLYENTDDKIIYFTSNLDRAVELYNLFPNDTTFYCSPSTSNPSAKEILQSPTNKIENNTFPTRILVSSRVLDMGITLLDKDIKHIICDIFDINVMQQCIGRKRIVDDSDTCTIYLREFHKGQLNLFRNKDIDAMRMFDVDEELCQQTYYTNREYSNKFIYIDKDTGQQKLNELALISINHSEQLLDEMMYEEWVNVDGELIEGKGYRWVLLNELGVNALTNNINEWREIEDEENKLTLTSYLDSIVGKRLFKDEQEELKLIFKKNGLSARTLGINTLNGNLKDRSLPYLILAKSGRERVDGKVKSFRYWELVDNVEC